MPSWIQNMEHEREESRRQAIAQGLPKCGYCKGTRVARHKSEPCPVCNGTGYELIADDDVHTN